MKILYIMSSYNIYGGTPKKTLDLLKHFKDDSALYVYSNSYGEFKPLFEKTGASIYEGSYGRNLFKHIAAILKIIDDKDIDIVQTQFSMGEILGGIVKVLRPQVKLVIAFVGSASPSGLKKQILTQVYKKVDAFVYISQYVKKEKINVFPFLENCNGRVIYNGIQLRENTSEVDLPSLKHPLLFDIAGLTKIKNIDILIDAIKLLLEEHREVFLYVAGDGPEKERLEQRIEDEKLTENIFLLGYRTDTEQYLKECDIFVHPCYVEGFGIAVTEAMVVEKPIVAAKAGALPELLEDGKSGLLVDPFDAKAWAAAIKTLIDNEKLATELGHNAKQRAEIEFSIEKYVLNYNDLYQSLMEQK